MSERKAERLLYLMTQLPDEILDEAHSYQISAPKRISWHKSGLVAACLCICLVGALAWNWLQEPTQLQPTEAHNTQPEGDVGGTSSRKPLDPTGGTSVREPLEPTQSAVKISEFWYEESLYVDTGVLLEELPEPCILLESSLNGNRLTKDKDLIGANVYQVPEDLSGLYVEEARGYRYYARADQ